MGQANKFPTLVCGNPRNKPASFTRFVFPFAYRPDEPEKNKKCENLTGLLFSDQLPRCKETEEKRDTGRKIIERRKYFTPEIAKVLFENAKWLELNPGSQETSEQRNDKTINGWRDTWWAQGVTFNCIKKNITVNMLPPRMVLFEWSKPNPSKPSKNASPMDIFQTGFLFVDLYFQDNEKNGFNKLPGLDELLQINEMFRHFDCPYPKHKENFLKLMEKSPVEYLKPKPSNNGNDRENSDKNEDQEKATTPTENSDNGTETVNSDACYFDFWATLLTFPVCIDNKIYRLVPKDLPQQTARFFMEGTGEASKYFVYADNRAYVWSAAIIKGSVKPLQRAMRTSEWQAHEFGHWVKFLNVDFPDFDGSPSKTHNSINEFEKNWAKERTYHRWESGGTWYGFNYHAGVMLGPPWNNPPKEPPLWRHFRQHYFDMAILLFYIRITLFRFSRELSETIMKRRASKKDKKTSHKEETEKFTKLRKEFLNFVVLYQFPLLSNQQQSIEMYALARKSFDVDELFEEVKKEIDNMHEFRELIETRNIGNVANKIAMYGIPAAISALFLTIFTVDYVQIAGSIGISKNQTFALLVFIILLIFITVRCFFKKPQSAKDKNNE